MENWKVKAVDGVEVEATPAAEEKVEQTLEAPVEEAAEEKVYETPTNDAGDYVVDLDKPVEPVEEVKEEEKPIEVPVEEAPVEETPAEEPVQDFTVERVEETEEETPVKEEPAQEVAQGQVQEVAQEPQVQLPDNVEKLIQFMDETGGTLEDYVSLNRDVKSMDDVSVIREYYKQTKPHYDNDDVSFMMDKNFAFDPEADEENEIRAKKLAFKEELYKAHEYLNGRKDKYYADLKLNKQNSVAPEYQKAYEFYNEQQKVQEENQKLVSSFQKKTEQVFNQDFKGFDFKVGDSRFRIKVGDVGKTMEYQKDLNNFINDFVGDDGTVSDIAGYHKAIYTARNADKLAQHFYEQGRADAIKQSAASAKNIDMKPRQDNSAITTPSGTKYKVVSGDSSSKLRIKMNR